MRKELEIGDEIVIYPEKGYYYTSLEIKNGCKNQVYNSSNFPETLIAVFMGREEGKDGKWYEKYTLKSIPKELSDFRLRGRRGFQHLIEELNKISEILQGTAEDGRKILYPRSINIEDVNEILGVVVDSKNRVVYQKNNPSKNINSAANFGNRSIEPLQGICNLMYLEFIEEKEMKSTVYYYSMYDLEISKKLKEIVSLDTTYLCASRFINIDYEFDFISFGAREFRFRNAYKTADVSGVPLLVSPSSSLDIQSDECAAVRPVFYLKSDIQNEVIEELQKI